MVNRFLKIEYLFFLFLLGISWGQDWSFKEDWTRAGKVMFFALGVGLFGAWFLFKKFHPSVALFYLYIIGQWFFLRLAPASMIEIMTISGTLFICSWAVFDQKLVKYFKWFLVFDGLFHTLVSYAEVAGIFHILEMSAKYSEAVWYPMGMHGHPTLVGAYLVACLPFIYEAASGRWKYVLSALTIGAVLICQSTMAFLSLLTCLTVWAGYQWGTRALFSIAGIGTLSVAGISYFYPSFASLTGRLDHWLFAWNNLTLPGFGSGTWMPIYWQYFVSQLDLAERGLIPSFNNVFFGQLHNDWLQGAFEIGVGVAFVAWSAAYAGIIALRDILIRYKDSMPFACAASSIAVNALGNFPMHVFPLGFVGAFCLLYLLKKPPSDLEALN